MSLKKNKTPDASVAEDLTASKPVTRKCVTCKGVGVATPDGTEHCADCQGSGTIEA